MSLFVGYIILFVLGSNEVVLGGICFICFYNGYMDKGELLDKNY